MKTNARLAPQGRLNRYSAKNVVKAVNFYCDVRDANAVFLVGDFNDWHPEAHPMRRQPDGAWQLQLELNHGHHHYMFLIDGQMKLDGKAQGVARNEQNEKVSLLLVS